MIGHQDPLVEREMGEAGGESGELCLGHIPQIMALEKTLASQCHKGDEVPA